MALQKNAQGLYEADIDGVSYEFSVWRTRRALQTLIDVAEIGGEFMAKGAGLLGKSGALTAEVDPEALSQVVEALVRGMTKDKNNTLNLVERLVTEGVVRNGKQVQFERDFEQNFVHLFKVVRAALEVQYGSFFAQAQQAGSAATSP